MSPSAGPTDGTARALPPGRLRSFEDDDAPDLAHLLPRRTEPSPDTAAEPAEPSSLPAPASAPTGVVRGEPATQRLLKPEPATVELVDLVDPADLQTSQTPQAPPVTASKHSQRPNRIRSSSVHIPVPLIDYVAAERQRTGASNGEIVIAALEQTHGQLPDLISRRSSTGGALFAARVSRGVRLSDGPLTPLNVRLHEADYAVIDSLVQQHGAYSRGHLITVALTAHLAQPATS